MRNIMVEIYREPINAATRSVKKKKKTTYIPNNNGTYSETIFFFLFFFLCQHFAFHIIGFTMISVLLLFTKRFLKQYKCYKMYIFNPIDRREIKHRLYTF